MRSNTAIIFLLFCMTYFSDSANSSNTILTQIEARTYDMNRKLTEALTEINNLKASVSNLQTSNDKHWQEMHERFFNSEYRSGRHSLATPNCKEICRLPGEQDLYLKNVKKTIQILCDTDRYLVFMQRFDGATPFQSKNWQTYKTGFGNMNTQSEFFLGLQNLHDITNDGDQFELLIDLEDFEGAKAFAKYTAFSVGAESEDFKLGNLGQYSGNAGDSFSYHQGQGFSTLDRDNDAKAIGSCGEQYSSAGWFKSCMEANLMGRYIRKGQPVQFQEGMYWETFRGPEYSLKKIKLSIRAVC